MGTLLVFCGMMTQAALSIDVASGQLHTQVLDEGFDDVLLSEDPSSDEENAEDGVDETSDAQEDEKNDEEAPASATIDAHAAQLLECQTKSSVEETKRNKLEMEAQACSRKLQDVETGIIKEHKKTKEEADLRAKAVAETKRALDEETKAVELADQEKKTRQDVTEQCEAEINALKDANAAAVLIAQNAAKEEEEKAKTAADDISQQALEEKNKIVAKANLDREQQISDIQNERDKQMKLAEDTKNAAIAAAEAESLQEETQLKSDTALAVQNARTAAMEAIRKARADRDAKVSTAEAERDEALETLEGLKKQVADKEAKAMNVEAERQQAVTDLHKYRTWAQDQLAEAKKKVQQAVKLAQAASTMQGTSADDKLLPHSLEMTINAANQVTKSLEDQVAGATNQPA